MKSHRLLMLLAILTIRAFLVFIVIGVALPGAVWVWIAGGAFVVIAFIFTLYSSMCPFCGHLRLHPRLWEADAVHCQFCGRLVEYNDQYNRPPRKRRS